MIGMPARHGSAGAFLRFNAKDIMNIYRYQERTFSRHFGESPPRRRYQSESPIQRSHLEEVMKARPIVPPLTLFDCCPITDGAAMTILTTPIGPKPLTNRPLV